MQPFGLGTSKALIMVSLPSAVHVKFLAFILSGIMCPQHRVFEFNMQPVAQTFFLYVAEQLYSTPSSVYSRDSEKFNLGLGLQRFSSSVEERKNAVNIADFFFLNYSLLYYEWDKFGVWPADWTLIWLFLSCSKHMNTGDNHGVLVVTSKKGQKGQLS